MDAAPGHARAVTRTALSDGRSEVHPGKPSRHRCVADSAESVLSCEHFFLFVSAADYMWFSSCMDLTCPRLGSC